MISLKSPSWEFKTYLLTRVVSEWLPLAIGRQRHRIVGWAIIALAIVLPRAVLADELTRAADEIPVRAAADLEVTWAARPPLVERPLFAAFDEQGRLYVLDSGGVNGDDRRQNPPDVIRRLEDTDQDGIFDRSQVFADKIIFGSGLAYHQGALYVMAPPSLWRMADRDQDGIVDERTELVTGFAFAQSCSDDAHGACIGRDGRLYFLPGRFDHQIRSRQGELLRSASGPWLMRCDLQGDHVEFVSGSVGNPVEVDFLPSGDAFLQGTYWAKPSFGSGLRDAVIHAVEGAEYAVRDRDYTDRLRTGEFLPALVPMTATAPSGCLIYRSSAWGADSTPSFFGSYFNTGAIQRHRLLREKSSFRAETEDVLTRRNDDVHFTDVVEDADGSLLAVDTGGWFRKCCPTSKIAKPEILGGIYRVRHRARRPLDDPRGLAIDWPQLPAQRLVDHLADDRFVVRERAAEQLVSRSNDVVPVLAQSLANRSDADVSLAVVSRQMTEIVWVLCRRGDTESLSVLRTALHHSLDEVRQAAASSLGLHYDRGALQELQQRVVTDRSPAVRREAAAAIGRTGDPAAARSLLEALAQSAPEHPDPFLDHALVLALMRSQNPAVSREGLGSTHRSIQRASLMALDQMPAGNLRADDVLAFLDDADERIRATAASILLRHLEWAVPVAERLEQWLAQGELSPLQWQTLTELLRVFQRESAVRQVIDRRMDHLAELTPANQMGWLTSLSNSGIDKAPPAWSRSLVPLLGQTNHEVAKAAIVALGRLQLREALVPLRDVARQTHREPAERLAAIRAISLIAPPLETAEFEWLLTQLDSAVPLNDRLAALDVLSVAQPNDEQLSQLVRFVSTAGVLELPRMLAAFRGGRSEAVGRSLVAALEVNASHLSEDLLHDTLKSYPESIGVVATPLREQLHAAAAQQSQQLANALEMLEQRPGDVQRGKALFFAKANCHLCHRVDHQGGQVGPDLSGIGAIRARRDLLEAILFPSTSFARGYEPIQVELQDGRQVHGLMGRETPTELIVMGLENNQPREIRVARSEIESLQWSRVSLMPTGLERGLENQDLADLIAFLSSLRTTSVVVP